MYSVMVQVHNSSNLTYFPICIPWNNSIKLIFAGTVTTSPGKGVVDGKGGAVKRSVWRYVKSGKANIITPAGYASVAKGCFSSIIVQFISSAAIDAETKKLGTYWEGVLAVSGTQAALLHPKSARPAHGSRHIRWRFLLCIYQRL